MYLSIGFSGMRMRESLKGEYYYEKADFAGRRGTEGEQPRKERETSDF